MSLPTHLESKIMRLQALDTPPRHTALLVPFAGYRLRLFNVLLDNVGEVSHFLLSVAGQTPLKPLLPKLGLTALQQQDLIQRLRQLNLLDDEQQLTSTGQTAAQLLRHGLQGKTRQVWLEQSLKESTPVGLMPIMGEHPDLQPRDHWPAHWPSLSLFDGKSAAQQQKRRWQGHLRATKSKGSTSNNANKGPTVIQLFPEAEVLNTARSTALPLDIAFETTGQVRYYALTVPLPGHGEALWQALERSTDGNGEPAHSNKTQVFAWPWVAWGRYQRPVKQDGTPWPLDLHRLTLARRNWRLKHDVLTQYLASTLDGR